MTSESICSTLLGRSNVIGTGLSKPFMKSHVLQGCRITRAYFGQMSVAALHDKHMVTSHPSALDRLPLRQIGVQLQRISLCVLGVSSVGPGKIPMPVNAHVRIM